MPSNGVFRFLDALSEFSPDHPIGLLSNKATNEFVLNMVEIGTSPSHAPLEVLKDYLFNYLMLQSVAHREQVSLVPLASLPMDYLPHMIPKWGYYVQNSILANKKQESWTMKSRSPLRAAGNCAGMHIHIEVTTPPEFLYSNDELKNKFNMGLMMTPMVAFSSSPYFFGEHTANSMRGLRYYDGVYKKFPLNGGLAPVMESSVQVLDYHRSGINHWIDKGTRLGFKHDELMKLTSLKGANWSPVRWNRQWNTIEVRCLESDSIELDGAKFIWVTSAFRRMDPKGEGLQCETLKTRARLDKHLLRDTLKVSGNKVSILPTQMINDIFKRAVLSGTKDALVEEYLNQLASFSQRGVEAENRWIFKILRKVLDSHSTTAEKLLQITKHRKRISHPTSVKLILETLEQQNKIIKVLPRHVPDIFQILETVSPEL